MKSLFITGGRGLIGQSIVAAALESNAFSRIVTLGRSERGEELPRAQILHDETGSIHDLPTISRLLDRHKTTHLVHGAGARTSECRADPGLAFNSNVRGTDIIFQASDRSATIEQTLFISTAAVYGKQNNERFSEDSPIAAASNYAVTKAAAEMAAVYHCPHTIIVRPGFTVGSAQSKLYELTSRILTNDKVGINFAPRFFVHSARDVGRAMVQLLLGNQRSCFHLPGHSLSLEDFGQLLQKLAAEKGFKPCINLLVDHSMAIPGDLVFDRFTAKFPGFTYDDPETIFRSILN